MGSICSKSSCESSFLAEFSRPCSGTGERTVSNEAEIERKAVIEISLEIREERTMLSVILILGNNVY